MVLNVKTRLVLAGAVLGASLLALATANAQIDPSTGAPSTGAPGTTQTQPGFSPTTPQPLPDFGDQDAGVGGSGLQPITPLPSTIFGGDDGGMGGLGGSGTGITPLPSTLGGLDAGLR